MSDLTHILDTTHNHCPDGGLCREGCAENNCMRVGYCCPLSGVFKNDWWPNELSFDLDYHEQHRLMEKLKS